MEREASEFHQRHHAVHVPYACLVNLIVNKEIVKEFIQDFTIDEITDELKSLLGDEAVRNQMIDRFQDIRDNLKGTAASNAAAIIAKGRQVAASVKQVLVVPGSQMVKAQAEAEGLDKIFIAAGMDWREPGCSMCLAMNADKLGAGEHCASTSNRNFEGRQGSGGRTHLMSPAMAAAAAIAGHIIDVRTFSGVN